MWIYVDEHNLASLLATTNLAFHPGFSSWLFILVYIEMVEMEQINIGGNKQACAFILGDSWGSHSYLRQGSHSHRGAGFNPDSTRIVNGA